MKHKTHILVAALAFSLMAQAQSTPEHDFDFEKVATADKDSILDWDDFYKFFDNYDSVRFNDSKYFHNSEYNTVC